MEADQGSRIGKAGRVERFQQLYDVSGFVVTEEIARGFEVGELAIEGVRGHGRFPTRVPHAWLAQRNLADDGSGEPGVPARPDGRGRPSLHRRIVHLFLTRCSSTVNPPEMRAQ